MRRKALFFKVIFVFVLVVAIVLIFGTVSELLSTHKLRKQHEAVTKELEEIQKINASLTNQKEKLSDPNYIQTYARGNYMFSKEGEQIFYLPSVDKEKQQEETNNELDKNQENKQEENKQQENKEEKKSEEKTTPESENKPEETKPTEENNQDSTNTENGENTENAENGQ